ncbi:MAG: DUF6431 domain-containing protein [Bacillota bacterium]
MQLIYYTSLTPEEYLQASWDNSIPLPSECSHPSCRIKIPPEKHGCYERNVVTLGKTCRIFIRRYYCSYCGHTFSYLPSFCLPYFQYSLDLIFLNLICHFFKLVPFLEALIQANCLNLQRQHRQFYNHRFLCNLTFIQLILRNLDPLTELPEESGKEKGAQKVLAFALSRFSQIQTFSTRFFAQSNHSFMTPCKLV